MGESGLNEVKSKVLVVDDEPGILNAIRRVLRKETFEIVVTEEPEEALQRLQHEAFAALISDQRMPTMEGTYLLEQARELTPDTVRILLTGYVDIHVAIEAINRGEVFRFITKPWDDEKLRSTVRQAVSQFELKQENKRLNALTEKQNSELAQLNKELAAAHQQEVHNASRIQQGLLQSQGLPELAGLEIAVLSIPSQQIDGDFYDFFEHGDHCLDLVVGDVMGKGVPAAILGAATKNQLLRAMNQLLADGGTLPSPEEVVSLAHVGVTRQLIDLESFVTVCYARFKLNEGQLDFVDCGHTKSVHFSRRSMACTTLQGRNMPLGVSASERYEQVRVTLEPGDILVFYSDGLTEAQNFAGELFGIERLIELVYQHCNVPPADLVEALHTAAVEYMGIEAFTDDFTCIVCRIKESV